MPRTHPLIEAYEESPLSGRLVNDAPDFRPGDTLRVGVRIVDGANARLQAFEGVCIARKRAGINTSFTLRRVAHGEGVERVFSLFSPRLASLEVVRRGRVRRSKLYYLRDRSGRSARIKERTRTNPTAR